MVIEINILEGCWCTFCPSICWLSCMRGIMISLFSWISSLQWLMQKSLYSHLLFVLLMVIL